MRAFLKVSNILEFQKWNSKILEVFNIINMKLLVSILPDFLLSNLGFDTFIESKKYEKSFASSLIANYHSVCFLKKIINNNTI